MGRHGNFDGEEGKPHQVEGNPQLLDTGSRLGEAGRWGIPRTDQEGQVKKDKT